MIGVYGNTLRGKARNSVRVTMNSNGTFRNTIKIQNKLMRGFIEFNSLKLKRAKYRPPGVIPETCENDLNEGVPAHDSTDTDSPPFTTFSSRRSSPARKDEIEDEQAAHFGSFYLRIGALGKYSGIRLLDIRIQDTFGFRTRNRQVPIKGIQAY